MRVSSTKGIIYIYILIINFYSNCPPLEEVDRVLVCVLSTPVANRICSCETLRFPKPSSTGKLPFSRPLSQTFSLFRVLPLIKKYRRDLKPPKRDKRSVSKSYSGDCKVEYIPLGHYTPTNL